MRKGVLYNNMEFGGIDVMRLECGNIHKVESCPRQSMEYGRGHRNKANKHVELYWTFHSAHIYYSQAHPSQKKTSNNQNRTMDSGKINHTEGCMSLEFSSSLLIRLRSIISHDYKSSK